MGETMLLQEKGWERRRRKGMKHHYEYIAPDGKTFENMAAALDHSKGNEDERKGGGGETASAEGGRDQSEQQNLDSDDGEEEEAGSGHNRVRGWGRATVEETVAMQDKGWQRRSVRVGGHYEYISPDGKTFAKMDAALRYALGKEDEREEDGDEAASAGSGCDEREQENLDSKREINLRTLLEMGFKGNSENIRVLTDCKVPDSLY